jgi:hypothetical protein
MLCLLLFRRKKEKKKKKERNSLRSGVPQGQTHLAGCAAWYFCSC